ncbi:hypothetical protein GZ78_22150 [Endozoicomonas numazuensis]|uniref:Glucose-methanol-choline oxidoreductase C-terminal domain-containing protein n=1 Tax=Endozoicomonas numazuensis TaxID=1137799 RepID=A0A081NDM3_9GAMM|nr:GMC oxidoreductase [Endozoicomonas numazuensis]KEQ16546.1 hypothetical protein GZ78_22150 [Endozoicomonas numazuensis]
MYDPYLNELPYHHWFFFQENRLHAEHITGESLPGGHVQSDDEILDYIRTHAISVYHPVGTCKMGSDPEAVFSSKLKVHGVRSCGWQMLLSCLHWYPETPMLPA